MIKTLDCPKCHQPPDMLFKYDWKHAVLIQCQNCGVKLSAWVYEDIEYCAVDKAAKDWNAGVKKYLRKQKKEDGQHG